MRGTGLGLLPELGTLPSASAVASYTDQEPGAGSVPGEVWIGRSHVRSGEVAR